MTSPCIPVNSATNSATIISTVTAAPPDALWIRVKQFALLIVVLGWGIGIAAGCLALWNHAGTPGRKLPGAAIWPEDSKFDRRPGSPILVLFVHPHCPCTRATLRELERLVAQAGGVPDIRVAFVQPSGTSGDWAHTDLWQAAAAIPGVTVTLDRNGLEARQFGARTSGEAFLFDSTGRLVFQGGITPARGHEGDSPGKTSLIRWLTDQPAEPQAPVFGCPLFDDENSQMN